MTPALFERARDLFNAAVELPDGERAAFLQRECNGDSALRTEVEQLLRFHRPDGALARSFVRALDLVSALESPAAEPARRIEHLGPYRILDVLNEGGMGVVYRAMQETPPRQVALKTVRLGLVTTDGLRRFAREGELAVRLKHPAIAPVFATGVAETTQGDLPYIAMELVEGRPLTEFATTRGLSMRDRIRLLVDVCDAVQYAHDRLVLHRDLKPANILVEEGTNGPRPRILDFGIAQLLDGDAEMTTRLTLTGQALGTPAYMSPEQACGRIRDLDVRTDVYSLGVIAYELLVGRLPFNPEDLQHQRVVRFGRVPAPRKSNPAIDRNLDAVLLKALAEKPSDRYASVRELRTDLERYLAGEALSARPESAMGTLWRLTRRHKLVAAGAGVLFGLVVAYAATVTGLYRWAAAAETRAASSANEARKRADAGQDLADLLIEKLARLEHVPGAAAIRTEILRDAYSRLDALTHGAGDDPQLLLYVAKAHRRLGDIDDGFGNAAQALEHHREARRIAESLVRSHAEDPDNWEMLSIALVRIGDLLHPPFGTPDPQRLRETQALYEEALAIDERLASKFPDTPRFLDNLCWSYDRLADMAQTVGDFDRRAEYIRARRELAIRIADARPNDPEAQLSLASSEIRQSITAELNEDRETQRTHLASAMRIAEDGLDRWSEDSRFTVLAISAHASLADALLFEHRTEDAAQHLSRVLPLATALYEKEPENFRYLEGLVHCCQAYALYHQLRAEFSAEADWLSRVVALQKATLHKEAAGGGASCALVDSLHAQHTALWRAGCHDEARATAAEMIQLVEGQLAAMDPPSPEWLDRYYQCFASAWTPEFRDWEKARRVAQQAVDLTGGSYSTAWRYVAESSARLGDCESMSAAALRYFETIPRHDQRVLLRAEPWFEELQGICGAARDPCAPFKPASWEE